MEKCGLHNKTVQNFRNLILISQLLKDTSSSRTTHVRMFPDGKLNSFQEKYIYIPPKEGVTSQNNWFYMEVKEQCEKKKTVKRYLRKNVKTTEQLEISPAN